MPMQPRITQPVNLPGLRFHFRDFCWTSTSKLCKP